MDTTLLLTRRALPAVALTCAAVLATGCSSSSTTNAAGDASAPAASSAPASSSSAAPPAAPPSPTNSPVAAWPGPCPTRSLQVKLGDNQGTAGSVYTTIVFTNISNV